MERHGTPCWRTRYLNLISLPVPFWFSAVLQVPDNPFLLSAKQTAFTTKKDYGKEERQAEWAHAQRTLHGLQPPEASSGIFHEKSSYRELSEIAEQAKRRAEVAR